MNKRSRRFGELAGVKDPPVVLPAVVGLLHGYRRELFVCNRRVLLQSGDWTATWLRVC